jgi:hypothetical protein
VSLIAANVIFRESTKLRSKDYIKDNTGHKGMAKLNAFNNGK